MEFQVIKNLEDLPKFYTDKPVFADIESEGLYIKPRLLSMYQPETSDKVFIVDYDSVFVEDMNKVLETLWTVWHNCSYDLGTLNVVPAKVDDTLYLSKTAYPEWLNFSLDSVVDRLGYTSLYDGLNKKELQKQGFVLGAYLSQHQLKYAATDVIALHKIWLDPRIQATRNIFAYKVDILSAMYATQYQQNGLIVNQEAVREELDKLVDVIANNDIALLGLNPNSPKQVREALGVESSNKGTLIKLIAEGNTLAELVYKQRRLLKRRTMLNSYNYPKVVTRFNAAGAATGRFTSSGGDLPRGINSQQIPRDLQYIFNTDTDETSVVNADFSTAELRAGCSIMQDEAMYRELMEGQDLHKVAASMAMGIDVKDVTKADRQKGKAISFGLIFGMSAPSFVEYAFTEYNVIFTQEEAAEIKRKYNTKYSSISNYHNMRWKDYKTKPVSTPLGRRNMPRLGTDAINYATQGCIAETTKLSVHYLVKEFPDALKYLYNVVHDAIYLRVPKCSEQVWADRLAASMKKGWAEMCKTPMLYYKDIPMPVEVEFLGQVKEY